MIRDGYRAIQIDGSRKGVSGDKDRLLAVTNH